MNIATCRANALFYFEYTYKTIIRDTNKTPVILFSARFQRTPNKNTFFESHTGAATLFTSYTPEGLVNSGTK